LESALDQKVVLPKPAILAQEAIGELEAAIAELQGVLQELGEDISL
jgi:type I restriction enzyme M protein